MKAGTNLEKVLESKRFAVTAEVGPPKGAGTSGVLKKGEKLKDFTDAINVTDNQTAIVRMCSLAGCTLLKRVGVDPVLQMVVRDRNRIALQSDILGAAAMGIGNILCLSGDYQSFGNHPTAKGVYDLDSTQLIQTLQKMRDERKFICGEDINGEVPFLSELSKTHSQILLNTACSGLRERSGPALILYRPRQCSMWPSSAVG